MRSSKNIEDEELFGPVPGVIGGGIFPAGLPRVPPRLMIPLLYLKHAYNESDNGIDLKQTDAKEGRALRPSPAVPTHEEGERSSSRPLGRLQRELRRKASTRIEALMLRTIAKKGLRTLMWLELRSAV